MGANRYAAGVSRGAFFNNRSVYVVFMRKWGALSMCENQTQEKSSGGAAVVVCGSRTPLATPAWRS